MITYTGKINCEDKIKSLLKEMAEDKDLNYTIQIYESRENETISKLMIEVINIQNSMPDF